MGVAPADEVQVEGIYSTPAAWEVDGPHVAITHDDGPHTLKAPVRFWQHSGR